MEIVSNAVNREFSGFDGPVTENNPPKAKYRIELVHDRITTDKNLKAQIDKLRTLEGKAYIREKEKLPFITPSGLFNLRGIKNIDKHSGLIVMDFDHLEEKYPSILEDPSILEKLKDRLFNDMNLPSVLIFISPSGKGLKWLIQIPADITTHLSYFLAIEAYVKKTYDLDADESGKDVARPCFFSYDPKAMFRDYGDLELGPEFLAQWTPVIEAPKARQLDNHGYEDASGLDELVQWVQATKSDLMPKDKTNKISGYNLWLKICLALVNVENGREYLHQICSHNPYYNEEDCDDKFDELSRNARGEVTLGSLFHIAKEAGYIIPKKTVSTASPVSVSKPNKFLKLKDQMATVTTTSMTPLMGSIWQKGELHILFADTGCGKSALAVQIADRLSNGERVLPCLSNDSGPQKVLLYDFELSDAMFKKRYLDKNDENFYEFKGELYRVEANISDWQTANPNIKTDAVIINQFKADIEELQPDIVIIDNITFLTSTSTQDANVAMDLIKALKAMKTQYGISMLVLAHTPKIKEGTPLTSNEMGGSKNLANFADSISAIGKSFKGEYHRYIKSTKVRNTQMTFGSSNVIHCELSNPYNFLGYTQLGLTPEEDHLDREFRTKDDKETECIRLHLEGKSTRKIAEELEIPRRTVRRYLEGYTPTSPEQLQEAAQDKLQANDLLNSIRIDKDKI